MSKKNGHDRGEPLYVAVDLIPELEPGAFSKGNKAILTVSIVMTEAFLNSARKIADDMYVEMVAAEFKRQFRENLVKYDPSSNATKADWEAFIEYRRKIIVNETTGR